MYIHPSSHVHPVFGSWLERRKRRIDAQITAIEEERFGDLVELIGADEEDRPPEPRSEAEREEYRRMLEDSRNLTERLIRVRGRLLEELRTIDRRRQHALPVERRSGRGSSLDGYL
jgi:hypothetical protein